MLPHEPVYPLLVGEPDALDPFGDHDALRGVFRVDLRDVHFPGEGGFVDDELGGSDGVAGFTDKVEFLP